VNPAFEARISQAAGLLPRRFLLSAGMEIHPSETTITAPGTARACRDLLQAQFSNDCMFSNTASCSQTHLRDLAARYARVWLSTCRPLQSRAQGMPGARCARCRVCRGSGGEHTRWSGHTGITRHSPRNGFNGFLRAPRRPGFLATVACGLASANLTPASGCQDHTTSPSASAPFVKSASASTASRPASVTIASRPSEWDGTKSQYACFYPAVK
jgi:hypothetical protein